MHDGVTKVAGRSQVPLPARVLVSDVEIEQHEHARLGVNAHQRDQADPDADAHVVAEQIQQPDGADRREGHRQEDDEGLGHRSRVHVEQHDHEEQRHRQHEPHPLLHALHRLVLSAPGERIAGRQGDLLADDALGLRHVAADVPAGDVHVDIPVLIAEHRRTAHEFHGCQLADRDLRPAVHRRHHHAP